MEAESLHVQEAPRVLVIDDDPALRTVLGKAFRHVGLTVDLAADGREGLARATEQFPDAIVLDLAMPEMDGLEFLQTYGRIADAHEIPIVVTSATQTLSAPRVRRHIGSRVFVRKPFDLEEMLALVLRLVGQACP